MKKIQGCLSDTTIFIDMGVSVQFHLKKIFPICLELPGAELVSPAALYLSGDCFPSNLKSFSSGDRSTQLRKQTSSSSSGSGQYDVRLHRLVRIFLHLSSVCF